MGLLQLQWWVADFILGKVLKSDQEQHITGQTTGQETLFS
jgi:hypothetical protein